MSNNLKLELLEFQPEEDITEIESAGSIGSHKQVEELDNTIQSKVLKVFEIIPNVTNHVSDVDLSPENQIVDMLESAVGELHKESEALARKTKSSTMVIMKKETDEFEGHKSSDTIVDMMDSVSKDAHAKPSLDYSIADSIVHVGALKNQEMNQAHVKEPLFDSQESFALGMIEPDSKPIKKRFWDYKCFWLILISILLFIVAIITIVVTIVLKPKDPVSTLNLNPSSRLDSNFTITSPNKVNKFWFSKTKCQLMLQGTLLWNSPETGKTDCDLYFLANGNLVILYNQQLVWQSIQDIVNKTSRVSLVVLDSGFVQCVDLFENKNIWSLP